MSTVLQPVGPLPPGTYWARRALVFGVPLILILIIAVSCSGGGKKKPSATPPTPKVTTTAAPPRPCTTSDLKLTLASDKSQYAIGEQPAFSGVFTNTGSVACTLTVSKAKEDWTVVSGTTQIWTTKGCVASGAKTKTKTIQPGATKTVSITWEGKLYSKCQPSADLQNGQYILHATLDGFTAPSAVTFEMTNATGG